MDQDFHYFGTYSAAMLAGETHVVAENLAEYANCVDFMTNGNFYCNWNLVKPGTTERGAKPSKDKVIATVDRPRLSFPSGYALYLFDEPTCYVPFHFVPGNMEFPTSFEKYNDLFGPMTADLLGPHEERICTEPGQPKSLMLTRPRGKLSVGMHHDLKAIGELSADDGFDLLLTLAPSIDKVAKEVDIDRNYWWYKFKQMLLGIRCHVIADTYAHQDFSGAASDYNMYQNLPADKRADKSFHVNKVFNYREAESGKAWRTGSVSILAHANYQGKDDTDRGHGAMGHFPDMSFIKFEYLPNWASAPVKRNNANEYLKAFLELTAMVSKFSRNNGGINRGMWEHMNTRILPVLKQGELNMTRVWKEYSADAWRQYIQGVWNGASARVQNFDVTDESLSQIHIPGEIYREGKTQTYGEIYVEAPSELYFYSLALDYHWKFIVGWLKEQGIADKLRLFKDSWSDADAFFEKFAE